MENLPKDGRAFNEGIEAAKNGLKCQDNPYKGRSAFGRIQSEIDYNDWLDGYLFEKGIVL
jgi:hypothetical protein